MSEAQNSEETHNPHWIADHGEQWIDAKTDAIHISAKAMNIVWGNDERFWRWIKLPKDESCFEVAAELVQVNYLEVTGSLDLDKFSLSPSTTYEMIFVIKFRVDAMGWHCSPVTFELITLDGHHSRKTQMLERCRDKGGHGWLNVHCGEFSMTPNVHGKLKFGFSEVQTGWWKGGMILEGVVIRPKLVESSLH